MSKSYGNTILLSEPEASIRQKLKTMVTDPARVRRSDPGDPDKCPVGDLHKIFSSQETMAKVYEGCRTAGIGCIECKGWAADSLWTVLVRCRSAAENMRPIRSWRGIFSKRDRRKRVGSLKQPCRKLAAPPTCRGSMSRPRRAQDSRNSSRLGTEGTESTGCHLETALAGLIGIVITSEARDLLFDRSGRKADSSLRSE